MRLAMVGGLLGLAAMSMAAAANVSSSVLSFEDNKMNFKSCDGQDLSARWEGAEFSVSIAGKKHGDPQPSIKYVGWDGACRTLGWDMKAQRFVHNGDTGKEVSRIINYVAWDGSRAGGRPAVSSCGSTPTATRRRSERRPAISRSSRTTTPAVASSRSSDLAGFVAGT